MKDRSKNNKTSWESSHSWYNNLVKEKGHYYHEKLIIPYLLKNLHFQSDSKASLLDLACGQGVLARVLPKTIQYYGFDIAQSLIKEAKNLSSENQKFFVADVTKNLPLEKKDFDYSCIILALQNISEGKKAIFNASKHLKKNGKLIIVLNHPCFRIPRYSFWEIDKNQKIEYRRMNLYMSEIEIPLLQKPSQKEKSPILYSYHHPISTYSQWLFESNFSIEKIDELSSDKKSTGSCAEMEDKARKEFPLFLTIIAKKIS
jgi:ubiquinone/menaquinone biosynthesis C-methylase UbiE